MTVFKKLSLPLCLAFVLAAASCTQKEEPDPAPVQDGITLSAPSVTDVTASGAAFSATIDAGSLTVLQKGFCYATASGPTMSDKTVSCPDALGAVVDGLKQKTTYYVRAYAVSSDKTVTYSKESSFTTLSSSSIDDYVAPAYADNYVSLGGWDQRSQWNLANVHDPTVCLAEDGYYYMYQTDASYGNAHSGHGHFHGRRSKDLVNWEYLGGTMPSLPSWVKTKLNEIRTGMGLPESNPSDSDFGYWAPCVRKVRAGLYRMYYSIVVPGYLDASKTSWGERAFIGLMETSDPSDNDSWVDKGYVVTNASDKGLNFYVSPTAWQSCYYRWNAIDPSYIITPEGEHWLIYGSWHSGIVAVQLNAETGKIDNLPNPWGTESDIAPYGKRIYTRKNGDRWQASEGPEIVYRDGWYYLFLAYDALDIPYNTRVVRSDKIDGPYYDMYGTEVSQGGGDAYPILTHPYKFSKGYGWVGISHCAVFDDGNGNWFYASQGRFPANVGGNAYSNAIMMGHVRRILWTSDGWPLVMPERFGDVPQTPITEDEIAGTWEHIDLGYKYGVQKEAETMEFGADHKITSGPWKNATWEFNSSTNILTANGVSLYICRECDWEASPRSHTLVYAGLGNKKTYWGKKVN